MLLLAPSSTILQIVVSATFLELWPCACVLCCRLLSETFIAEVEHTRAAAAAAFATLQAGSHKVNPWDAGRLFSTACATFLVLSPLNCFHCRYDASSAASAPSFSNKRTTRGANSSRADTGLSDDGSSSSSRSRSRCSSTNKERSSSLDSCNLAALTPQQQLKVAFRCRCECCGSRLGSDGRGLSSSSGNTNESIRIAFHISTFRTEEHIAVIDALLPPTCVATIASAFSAVAAFAAACAACCSDFDATGVFCVSQVLLRSSVFDAVPFLS